MALSIGNKTFMNLQEAVGWLLENNALPYQSTANYAGGVEIAMSTLINPSPAKVRVGSIIFFADSKVSTVVGITSNSFIVSDQYNDLVDDIVYVSNVVINASGHLIVTLSNGNDIDAGLVKQISSIAIDASQHLIASYNDGSSIDLGALGDFSNADFTAKTLNQTQPNISYTPSSFTPTGGMTYSEIYNRFEVINNILHIVINYKITNNTGAAATLYTFGSLICTGIPRDISSKIIDFEGHKVSDTIASDTLITMADCCVAKGTGANDGVVGTRVYMKLINKTTADYMTITPWPTTGYTIQDGESLWITARTAMTLL